MTYPLILLLSLVSYMLGREQGKKKVNSILFEQKKLSHFYEIGLLYHIEKLKVEQENIEKLYKDLLEDLNVKMVNVAKKKK